MNAQEAKKKALENKKEMEETSKLRKEKSFNVDVNLLLNHFHGKIKQAVDKGRLAIDPVEFSVDRFSDDVVREVASDLKEDGYHLVMEKHNAYQKVKFTISWS
jgi:hypothetical protein